MTNSTSRFAKYKREGDFPPLWKPNEGESRTGRLVGDREHTVTNDNGSQDLPVLDLVDVETGEEWSFMSGAWRWLDELSLADPQPGDVIRILRGHDLGKSRDLRLEIVETAAGVVGAGRSNDSDIPF